MPADTIKNKSMLKLVKDKNILKILTVIVDFLNYLTTFCCFCFKVRFMLRPAMSLFKLVWFRKGVYF